MKTKSLKIIFLITCLLLLITSAAKADRFPDIPDWDMRDVANSIKLGEIFIVYCQSCDGHYQVLRVFKGTESDDGMVLLTRDLLLSGHSSSKDNLSIDTDQKCGATPEDWISLYDPTIPRITEYLDFPYTFRQTDVPNVFQWIGVGTSLEQQRGKMIKSLKLTPEELKKVEECNTTFPSLWSPENPEPELKPEDQKHTKPEDPTK